MKQKSKLSGEMFTVSSNVLSENGAGIFYGMTILLTLADAFYRQGCHLDSISEKHGFALSDLNPIVNCLEKANLLERHPENRNWLYLKQAPEGRWIIEVIPSLKRALTQG